jgi:hypothetical protein
MTAERHTSTFSRRVFARALHHHHPLRKAEGAGKTGWPLHPGLPRKKKFARVREPQVQAVTTGLPCAVAYGLYALSSVNQRLPPSPAQCVSIVASLAPAWARQDHTTSPSASCAARQSAHPRPPHPHLTFVTTAIRPSGNEAGYAEDTLDSIF